MMNVDQKSWNGHISIMVWLLFVYKNGTLKMSVLSILSIWYYDQYNYTTKHHKYGFVPFGKWDDNNNNKHCYIYGTGNM